VDDESYEEEGMDAFDFDGGIMTDYHFEDCSD